MTYGCSLRHLRLQAQHLLVLEAPSYTHGHAEAGAEAEPYVQLVRA